MDDLTFETSRIPSNAPEAMTGIFAVQLNYSHAAILYSDGEAKIISLIDYSHGAKVPPFQLVETLESTIGNTNSYLKSRDDIATHLNLATVANLNLVTVPNSVLALRTAAPLNGSDTLRRRAVMYRFTAGQTDICFDSKTRMLRANTYLVPQGDMPHTTTGYGAVGRYSLPCPYPARFLHEYLLLRKTKLLVGTVEPQFRQSGGGVEVKLTSQTRVIRVGTTKIADY